MNENDVDAMVTAYVECALWSSLHYAEESAEPVPMDGVADADDIAPETLAEIRSDCADFYDANAADLASMDPGQAGHDFWLTRNHHGAGFWDRGLGAVGDRLTAAAHVYGGCDLYVGDDGKVYV